MFKNFGKVFKFTFHNQTGPGGYKILTAVIALLLLAVPVVILLLMSSSAQNDQDKKLESCGADKIYVADMVAEGVNFDQLKTIQGEGYDSITYVTVKDKEEALSQIKAAGEKKSFVLEITKDDEEQLNASIILPDGSSITADQAGHFYDAIKKMDTMFVILARGISIADMQELSMTVDTDLYKAAGWANGESLLSDDKVANEQSNEKMRQSFSMIITMLVCFLMYFIVLAYGSSITKNIVMEKSSKLMDTLLISVKPKALIFGKLTGVLAAGLLQLFIWLAALVGGVVLGVILSDKIYPDAHSEVITFLKSFGSLELFQPVPVILALIVLIFGIILYSSLAAMAGAISNTMEQAASNQGIFIIILIISYFLVISKGIDPAVAPTWLYLVPFTAALTLPAGLVLGTVTWGIAIGGVAAIVGLALILVALAGNVYKAMALYKGEGGGLGKVFKILTTKS